MFELWNEIGGRSGEWFAALAGLTLKAGLILAVTGLIAFALRRRSAALRHQVWLVGVGAALMLPVLALALPSFPVAAPWWPGPRPSAGEAWGGPGPMVIEIPSIEVPVAVIELPSDVAHLEERLVEIQEQVARATALADRRVEESLARAEAAVARAAELAHRNGERSIASAERQLAAAERALAMLERERERVAARTAEHAVEAVRAGGAAVAGAGRGVVRVGPSAGVVRIGPVAPHPPVAVAVEPIAPLPPMPAAAPLPPMPVAIAAPPAPATEPWMVHPSFEDWSAVQAWSPGWDGGWGGGFPWGAVLLGAWLLGVWFVAAGLVIGAVRVAWIGWQATPIGDGRVTTLARAIADELGVGEVRVLRGSVTAMPMTWGLRRATVLLPAGAEAWPVDQLDAVLRHELAHARRRDTLTQLFADIACAIYWFNPLVWLAAYRLRVEREHACDDEVLASGSKPSDYATQLLDMTRALRAARLTAMASIPMARPSQLRDRLEAVLDEDRTRGRVTRTVALRTWACATLLALPLAMLGFAPTGSFADEAGAADFEYVLSAEPEAEWAVVDPMDRLDHAAAELRRRASGLNAAAAAWSSGQPCRAGDDGSLSIRRNDDRQEIAWRNGACRGEIRIEGDVDFSEDFTRIVGLARGAEVRIEDEDGRTRRVLDIRPGRDGLEYDYAVDGRAHAFDDEAQVWLDGMVLQLMRMGYMAEERVAWLLDTGGVEAVIQELPHLRASYAKRLYYTAALVSEDVRPEQAAALVQAAGREIDSDHDLAELLIATANARSVGAELRNAFIAAASSIQSDHDLRRVLETVLANADLSPADVSAMLTLARSIESDHDLAELLIGLADRYVTSPELRARYLEAAAGIGSDHDKRRVLQSVLDDGALSAEDAAVVLELSQTIRSDHDRAELLAGLSDDALDAPALQRSYIESAAGIGSDHDQRRVLGALLERTRLGDDQLGLLLEAAREIGSDHDKAELLLQIADTQSLSDRNRDLFLGLLETVASDHDHGRVASALLRAGR